MDGFDIESFAAEFERAIAEDDDSEAREILASGMPIHIRHEGTPPGCVVRLHPDGREEVVRVDREAMAALLGR